MKMQLIYPKWPKLEKQTEFHLPPHGPVVFAAALPDSVDLEFVDENVEKFEVDENVDMACISVMLTCQLPRAFEIAARYRNIGIPVLFGGIAAMLHANEVQNHADSVFLGEVEGRMEGVLDDFRQGKLKKVYDYMNHFPDIRLVKTANRNILKRDLYNYRGVQMLDLVHASRGCKFNCFPCCNGFLGGKQFRPRPIDLVIKEMAEIPNHRLFVVDNSLAHDKKWLIELFTAMKPLKKKWVSHPLMDDDEVLKLAAEAGCWYVYQAIFDTSEVIKNRVKRLHDHGIGVEGTILLGTDDHDEAYVKTLVDFLMQINLDLAEFTILTPFPKSPIREKFKEEGRITSNNWVDYTCGKVVFQPKQLTPEKLEELYDYAWDTFYAQSGYQTKMGELFFKVMKKEILDGTYQRYAPKQKRFFKKNMSHE
ncbi:MAG: cobalamin-dependent protein [Proteobacteria bacterium]|nr:cobalamin-dependent protein [Pseudomonadota bacterium]MBU4472075.1 cobalamin-dependent protein [Pseudomonadota bacterium]MCG2752927.1 radical SAM protein [Desulfobacteraceae bacterium]